MLCLLTSIDAYCPFQTYHQAVREAKVQYSEEKKAYDNRSPEEVEAANAAAAAALAVSHQSLIRLQTSLSH